MHKTIISLAALSLLALAAPFAEAQSYEGFQIRYPAVKNVHPWEHYSDVPTLDLSATEVHIRLGRQRTLPEAVTGPPIKRTSSRHTKFFFAWPRHNRTWPAYQQRQRRYRL